MELNRRLELTEKVFSQSTAQWKGARRFTHSVGPVTVEWRVFLESEDRIGSGLGNYFKIYQKAEEDSQSPDLIIYARGLPQAGLWEDLDAEFYEQGPVVFQRDFCAQKLSAEKVPTLLALMNPHSIDSIHNLLRWALPPILLKKNAVLLHSSCVVSEGGGYVFFGYSGAGKSTTATLIQESDSEAVLLGDDASILEIDSNHKVWVHSAPLGCGYSSDAPPPIKVPLARLFALSKNPQTQIVQLARVPGAISLLTSVMTSAEGSEGSLAWDIDLAEECFELVSKMGAHAPCGIEALYFEKDPKFWKLIKQNTIE